MLLIVSIIITAELYSTFKYHMKIGETTRCCSFFLRTHVKISSKISIIEFNIQIKWCIIVTPSREAEKDYQGHFNSPPHKKNHIATTMINTVLFKISTHILTKRMTEVLGKAWIRISHFNSHPREEDDFTFVDAASFAFLFQLTSSRRGWLQAILHQNTYDHFNSHPHEEDDPPLWVVAEIFDISTHILTKRMTIRSASIVPATIFQLTPSRRGWLCSQCSFMNGWQHFNSHPHEEDGQSFNDFPFLLTVFQLTSSRRGWHWSWTGKHECNCISTHILTKRMTECQYMDECANKFQLTSSRRGWQKEVFEHNCEICISTHILTKRMTVLFIPFPPQFPFQLTSSRRGWLYFASRPSCGYCISTHILTKRMTSLCRNPAFTILTFQLTSSRRGWHNSLPVSIEPVHFNSHPHEEDDGTDPNIWNWRRYFNSHPHEEDDHLWKYL